MIGEIEDVQKDCEEEGEKKRKGDKERRITRKGKQGLESKNDG